MKIAELRVFEDAAGKMNLALSEVGGSDSGHQPIHLVGRLPQRSAAQLQYAAKPQLAEPLFHRFVEAVRGRGITVETGRFGAHMKVELINDGPVTLLLDTQPSS